MNASTVFETLADDLPFGDSKPEAVSLFKENCPKCNGTGSVIIGYTYRRSATCFNCDGKGVLEFKMSKEAREKSRKYAQARKAKQEQAKQETVAAWLQANPVEAAWLQESKFDFATAMLDALNKFGSLTEKQLAAVRKCVASDAERKAKWQAEKKAAEAAAPVVSNMKIEMAFASAQEKGIKSPKLRLDGFIFSLAKATSANAGALYVKTKDGEYMGKVLGGKFLKTRGCQADQEAAIVAAANDPEAAAIAYGKREGSCAVCGKPLTKGSSIDLGIGPICAERMGW